MEPGRSVTVTGPGYLVPEAQGQAPQKTFVLTDCSGTWGWATSLAFLELQPPASSPRTLKW